jgi:hypothetical protein
MDIKQIKAGLLKEYNSDPNMTLEQVIDSALSYVSLLASLDNPDAYALLPHDNHEGIASSIHVVENLDHSRVVISDREGGILARFETVDAFIDQAAFTISGLTYTELERAIDSTLRYYRFGHAMQGVENVSKLLERMVSANKFHGKMMEDNIAANRATLKTCLGFDKDVDLGTPPTQITGGAGYPFEVPTLEPIGIATNIPLIPRIKVLKILTGDTES